MHSGCILDAFLHTHQEAVNHLTPFGACHKELVTLLLLCEAPLGLDNLLEGTPAIPNLDFDHFPSCLPQYDQHKVLQVLPGHPWQVKFTTETIDMPLCLVPKDSKVP